MKTKGDDKEQSLLGIMKQSEEKISDHHHVELDGEPKQQIVELWSILIVFDEVIEHSSVVTERSHHLAPGEGLLGAQLWEIAIDVFQCQPDGYICDEHCAKYAEMQFDKENHIIAVEYNFQKRSQIIVWRLCCGQK